MVLYEKGQSYFMKSDSVGGLWKGKAKLVKGTLFRIYFPVKVSKGGKEIVQACDGCHMPGF